MSYQLLESEQMELIWRMEALRQYAHVPRLMLKKCLFDSKVYIKEKEISGKSYIWISLTLLLSSIWFTSMRILLSRTLCHGLFELWNIVELLWGNSFTSTNPLVLCLRNLILQFYCELQKSTIQERPRANNLR